MRTSQPRHELVFAEPRYLDIAFDHRDLEVECGFLEHLSRTLGRGSLDSFVEICAGPGYHVHCLAGRGVRGYGTTCHSTVLGYAEEKARQYGSGQQPARILFTDPRDFTLPEAVDLAFCPRGAFHYLLSNEDVLSHLVAVAKNVGRGGLYVIEMDHPAMLFGQRSGQSKWEAKRDDTLVRFTIGSDQEQIDPITQLYDLEICLEIEEGGSSRRVRDVAPVRAFTYQEMRALVRLSGVFDWVATFGDLTVAQPFDVSEGARAQVPVLRCSV